MSAQEAQGQSHAAGFAAEGADIQHLCQLGQVSRAGYYRHIGDQPSKRDDADLRDAIQRIAIKDRHYGYRRITHELRRAGRLVNAKRVLRLMRDDNLLSLRAKPYAPRTTDSRHSFRIVPNLVRGLTPSGLDQIWVADITYVRLMEGFVYLAVVLDAFSRRAIGWALDDHLEASLAIAALDMAITVRATPLTDLIHHSDRGVQYASNDYIERLQSVGARVSMSRPANPYDNAKAESFMKTLKVEEINGKNYRYIEEARNNIGQFIDENYNRQRLHSSIGYQPPIEFEAELRQAQRVG
jgi:putative transposase